MPVMIDNIVKSVDGGIFIVLDRYDLLVFLNKVI